MSRLFGPRPMLEIVLTVFDNKTVGFQFTGLGGTYTAEDIRQLLLTVAANIYGADSPIPSTAVRAPLMPMTGAPV